MSEKIEVQLKHTESRIICYKYITARIL